MKKNFCALFLTLVLVASFAISARASEQRTVQASTPEKLMAALQSNTTIILEDKTYVGKLELNGLENVTIRGTGSTRIVVDNGYEEILSVVNCKNITLEGLVMGHEIQPRQEECNIGVLYIVNSSVTISKCDIYGCGLVGIGGYNATIKMQDSIIRDCSYRILELTSGTYTFQNCTFSGNGYDVKDPAKAYAISAAGSLKEECVMVFTDCIFSNNKPGNFVKCYKTGGGASYTLNNCTFSGNGWTGFPSTYVAKTAYASTQEIEVDGKKVTFEAYALKDANGNDTNYIKLRDVASVLNGTPAQFDVGWNGSVTITTGQAYTPNGSEMNTPYSGNRFYQDASAATVVNGSPVELSAILLTDDNGNGYTYYKLRDLGTALGFTVDWSVERGIFIETN